MLWAPVIILTATFAQLALALPPLGRTSLSSSHNPNTLLVKDASPVPSTTTSVTVTSTLYVSVTETVVPARATPDLCRVAKSTAIAYVTATVTGSSTVTRTSTIMAAAVTQVDTASNAVPSPAVDDFALFVLDVEIIETEKLETWSTGRQSMTLHPVNRSVKQDSATSLGLSVVPTALSAPSTKPPPLSSNIKPSSRRESPSLLRDQRLSPIKSTSSAVVFATVIRTPASNICSHATTKTSTVFRTVEPTVVVTHTVPKTIMQSAVDIVNRPAGTFVPLGTLIV